LVRALQLAFANGATTVFAVRVSGKDPNDATKIAARPSGYTLRSGSDDCLRLLANSPGSWGDDVTVKVETATENPVVTNEEHPGSEGQTITLKYKVVKNPRNRFRHFIAAQGITVTLTAAALGATTPQANQYLIDANGKLLVGNALTANDKIVATYLVDTSEAV